MAIDMGTFTASVFRFSSSKVDNYALGSLESFDMKNANSLV